MDYPKFCLKNIKTTRSGFEFDLHLIDCDITLNDVNYTTKPDELEIPRCKYDSERRVATLGKGVEKFLTEQINKRFESFLVPKEL